MLVDCRKRGVVAGLHKIVATWQSEPEARLAAEALHTGLRRKGGGTPLLPPSGALPPIH